MARHTMKDVNFYIELINDKYIELGVPKHYTATSSCGTKMLVLTNDNEEVPEWSRTGYTTGMLYEVVVNIYECICRTF